MPESTQMICNIHGIKTHLSSQTFFAPQTLHTVNFLVVVAAILFVFVNGCFFGHGGEGGAGRVMVSIFRETITKLMGKNQRTQLESERKVRRATVAPRSSDANSVGRLHSLVLSLITHSYKFYCSVITRKHRTKLFSSYFLLISRLLVVS